MTNVWGKPVMFFLKLRRPRGHALWFIFNACAVEPIMSCHVEFVSGIHYLYRLHRITWNISHIVTIPSKQRIVFLRFPIPYGYRRQYWQSYDRSDFPENIRSNCANKHDMLNFTLENYNNFWFFTGNLHYNSMNYIERFCFSGLVTVVWRGMWWFITIKLNIASAAVTEFRFLYWKERTRATYSHVIHVTIDDYRKRKFSSAKCLPLPSAVHIEICQLTLQTRTRASDILGRVRQN